MQNGKTKELKCDNCNRIENFKVNKLYAKESKILSILAGTIFFIGTAIGLLIVMDMISDMKTVIGIAVVACGLLVPGWVYNIIVKEDRRRVITFNHTYVNE